LDHAEDGLENFASITGGKLTTYRLMAEKATNLICSRMGISRRCRTRTDLLPSTLGAKWTKPGLAPKLWMRSRDADDMLMCECEMVSRSVVDSLIASIHEQEGTPDLKALGLRSRIGKGAGQGTFCSNRVGGACDRCSGTLPLFNRNFRRRSTAACSVWNCTKRMMNERS